MSRYYTNNGRITDYALSLGYYEWATNDELNTSIRLSKACGLYFIHYHFVDAASHDANHGCHHFRRLRDARAFFDSNKARLHNPPLSKPANR